VFATKGKKMAKNAIFEGDTFLIAIVLILNVGVKYIVLSIPWRRELGEGGFTISSPLSL